MRCEAKKMKKLLLFTVLILGLTPLWGGISPKPEMDFSFQYQTTQTPAVLPATSEQIQCKDNQCMVQEPLGVYGIQRLYCQTEKCFSIAYEYAPFQKLIIDFSDGVKRQSNVFATPSKLRNHFIVTVREKDLLVAPSAEPQKFNALARADAWASLIIILLIELVAAFAYLYYTEKSYRVLYSVFLVNLITMPVSWQFLANVVPEPTLIWLFSLVFEAVFIWLLNRKTLTLRNSAVLSLAINVSSYSSGIMISFLLAPYLF